MATHRAAAAVLTFLFAACASDNGAGEARGLTRGTPIVIEGFTPSCAECSLRSELAVTLGSSSDRETFRHLPDIVRDSRGNYYAAGHGWGGDLILRYDSTGTYLGPLGARGEGPGEYDMTMGTFIGPGDSVFVLGHRSNLMVFAPDGRFVRSFTYAIGRTPVGVIPGSDGAMFAGGSFVPLMKGLGNYFGYVLGPDGAVRDSFSVFASRLHIPRHPVMSTDGVLWTFGEAQLRFEGYTPDGRSLGAIGVSTPLFQKPPVMTMRESDSIIATMRTVRVENRTRSEALQAHMKRNVVHAVFDRDGVAWLATHTAAPNWESAGVEMMKESYEAPSENLLAPDDESALRNTVIEILDTRRGVLIARLQLPFGAHLIAPGYAARPVSDASGHLRMEIHRLTFLDRR